MLALSFEDLFEYTDWQRARWREWFRQRPEGLTLNTGEHGDGRLRTVGEVVKHIFGAELRYVQRLSDQPLDDLASVPSGDVEELFNTGDETRQRMKQLLRAIPADQWDRPRHFTILKYQVTATPKKIVAHALMHEVRHWAQLATICRMSGQPPNADDLLASPVWGGEFIAP